ncbi:MAG: ATP-binding protein [Bacillota bacterium]|nr:ATP-binding protein [Bacillota bacterium]
MKELSLHILDIATNSIDAGASKIEIKVKVDTQEDYFRINIKDNGKGIGENIQQQVMNPFYTTRKVRKVGLGIPLLKAAAEQCEGFLKIQSEENVGTEVTTEFKNSHIDRAPLGKIEESILTILNFNEKFDLIYIHDVNGKRFVLDTREIKEILGEVDIKTPKILMWIKGYIKENIDKI